MKRLCTALFLTLAACGGSGDRPSPAPAPPSAGLWEAGPTIPGFGNYSAGTVLTESPAGEVTVDIPQQGMGATHYITRPISLVGMSALHVRASIDLAPGVQLFPLKDQQGGACDRCAAPTIMSLYFEQAPNDWQTDGQRWYFQVMSPIEAGPNFDVTVPLTDERWGSVKTMTARANPDVFIRAKAQSVRAGICIGGGDGLCHGVYAVGGSARITFTFEAVP